MPQNRNFEVNCPALHLSTRMCLTITAEVEPILCLLETAWRRCRRGACPVLSKPDSTSNIQSSKDAPTNPRGIPFAPFVDKVEDYVTSREDVESTLKSFQEMISYVNLQPQTPCAWICST